MNFSNIAKLLLGDVGSCRMIQIVPLKCRFKTLRGVRDTLRREGFKYAVVYREIKPNGGMRYNIEHITDDYSECEKLIRKLRGCLHKKQKVYGADRVKVFAVKNRA